MFHCCNQNPPECSAVDIDEDEAPLRRSETAMGQRMYTGCWKADQGPDMQSELDWTDISWNGSSFDVPVGVVERLPQLAIIQKSKA